MPAHTSAHLVERAAERLLKAGALEASTAKLLGPEPQVPPRAAPLEPEPPTQTASVSEDTPGNNEAEQREQPQPPGPVIAMLALERAGMFNWSGKRSRISEEFRLTQRQLLRTAFAPTAEPGIANLLMVTSAKPREGKSFAALNLAGSVAAQGDHKALLIDADARRDSLCRALGLLDASGVLDLAADPRLDPAEVILRTELEHLSILPVGRERGRSSQLFASRDMAQLIQRLGRRYTDTLLILDAGPCLSNGDPSALAPIVRQILFVVEAERTQRDEVEAALDLIQTCPSIMLLLNKVQVSNRHTFGAHSNDYSS